MKASVGVAAVIILALIGTLVSAYSYTHLHREDVLFNENSIQLYGQSYSTWQVNIIPGNVFSIFSLRIVGSVSNAGTGVDFYLVNFTNWISWRDNPEQRLVLSVVYLNSDAQSSQSAQGNFSFTPSSYDSYDIVLVNDNYPNASTTSVDMNITLQYISLFSFFGFIAGLTMLIIAIVTATREFIVKRTHRIEKVSGEALK